VNNHRPLSEWFISELQAAADDYTMQKDHAAAALVPFVQYYFRYAAYDQYPVVGVNWYQANNYAKWRSDRVNELILQKRGLLRKNPNQVNEDIYTTETYTGGQYDGLAGLSRQRDLDPNGSKKRNLNYSDGILLPDYRLPTEAEWEYAALGYYGNNPEPDTKRRRGEEVLTHRNVYPWGDPHTTRSGIRNQYQGEFLANFKRAKGDVMGSPAALNDNADITAPVNSYEPNNIGLYNMAGNVSEWVLDTYRPITNDQSSFRPFRGNEYYTYKRNTDDGTLEDKDSLGHLTRRPLTQEEVNASGRRFDEKGYDVRDYNDGDSASTFTYDYGKTSLLNNNTKVIKGASWNDYAYWLSPGTRRFMQADQASATVGFRCVMDRLGSPNGNNNQTAGNYFGKGKGKMRR
jgi:formylglycine-generating enzyme required for sulfatase activity